MGLKKSYVKEQFDTKDVAQTVDNPNNGFYTTFLAKDGSNNHDFILKYTDSSTTYSETLATEAFVASSVFDGAYSSLTGVPSIPAVTSAGNGITRTTNVYNLNTDLRGAVDAIGVDTDNYIIFDSEGQKIDFFTAGVFVARLNSSGELHVKGDIVAFSNIF